MRIRLKSLPEKERPRERMIKFGVKSLSDRELLALILKSGNKNLSVIDLSNEIVSSYKSLKRLANVSYEELCKINGIKMAKATSLLAALELGRRVFLEDNFKILIKSNKDIYNLMFPEVCNLLHETVYVISLNTKGYLISYDEVSEGNSNCVSFQLTKMFQIAIKNMASAIIVVHNHPSGNSSPSKEDREVTKNIIKASNTIGVNLIDHIIIGQKEIYSFLHDKKEYYDDVL